MLPRVNLSVNRGHISGFLFNENRLHSAIILACLCVLTQTAFSRGLSDRGEMPHIDRPVTELMLSPPDEELLSGEKPMATRPEKYPEWVKARPKTTNVLYVVAKSARIDSERAARSDAQERGRTQLAQYIAAQQRAKKDAGGNVVSVKGLKAKEYYTEIYLDDRNYKQYVVYVLMAIERKQLVGGKRK